MMYQFLKRIFLDNIVCHKFNMVFKKIKLIQYWMLQLLLKKIKNLNIQILKIKLNALIKLLIRKLIMYL